VIVYANSPDGIEASMLKGFFNGWSKAPSPETHLEILCNSRYVWLAREGETGCVVGFINAISDGVLSAYIPLLEVLPEYRHRGIGKELVGRMLETLQDFYMVDLTCDGELRDFYSRMGMKPSSGMFLRKYENQAGIEKK
jgi:ribosomal protein S18 acetylase RimI-like enzyme